jgi:periplasmic divalent cation tolerance protein
MTPDQDLLMIITAVPEGTIAMEIANGLVQEHLCGCVQIQAPMTSVYWWQGEVCQSPEQLLLIKTLAQNYDRVEQYLRAHHPYQVPEIIAVPVVNASSDYRQWLQTTCGGGLD